MYVLVYLKMLMVLPLGERLEAVAMSGTMFLHVNYNALVPQHIKALERVLWYV